MTVAAVAPAGDGKAVLLADPAGQIVVPIFVGGTEGLSIELRQEKRRYQRPLTHDLLDSVMRELGGELDKVQVDDLKSNVFIGTVFVRQGTRVVPIDARPSDAIALALGADAPIFVARKVVEAAGVRRDQLDGSGEPGRPRVPAGEPESL
jgi:bifunctional DNase/RNase